MRSVRTGTHLFGQLKHHTVQSLRDDDLAAEAGAGSEKAATYVINWNAPIVTGQTEAQLGRTLRRMTDRAAQRYPGDV